MREVERSMAESVGCYDLDGVGRRGRGFPIERSVSDRTAGVRREVFGTLDCVSQEPVSCVVVLWRRLWALMSFVSLPLC